jgi:hypothetical protein
MKKSRDNFLKSFYGLANSIEIIAGMKKPASSPP